jgi:cobalt-zinc-cadmium efflux system membrane fusion protein
MIARRCDTPIRSALFPGLLAALLLAGCTGGPRAGDAAIEEHPDDAALHVELSAEAVRNARIAVGVAAPADIAVVVDVPGEVHLDAERVLEVRPRFPGIVRDLRKRLGDSVRSGEVVAIVQSNESLADYELESSLAGTVISRPVVTGQSVDRETPLYVIADLSSVWVDFAIYPQYLGRIRRGAPVRITVENRPDLIANAEVQFVGPLLEQDTRVSSARLSLPNGDGRWQPGLFVMAHVTIERTRVPVAVPEDAVIRSGAGRAVFRARGNRFELTPVSVGVSDGRRTEIREGLSAGDSVVVANAFILKSELGKGEAEHEH